MGGAAMTLATGYGDLADRPEPSDENRGSMWIDPSTQTLTVQMDGAWHEITTTPEPPPAEFSVVYNVGTDELVVTALAGFDFTPVVTINYTGNGNGQITDPPWFYKQDQFTIVVPNAAFALNGGVLTQLDFFVGPVVAATWTGAVNMF
jgi:hypothetical protein